MKLTVHRWEQDLDLRTVEELETYLAFLEARCFPFNPGSGEDRIRARVEALLEQTAPSDQPWGASLPDPRYIHTDADRR